MNRPLRLFLTPSNTPWNQRRSSYRPKRKQLFSPNPGPSPTVVLTPWDMMFYSITSFQNLKNHHHPNHQHNHNQHSSSILQKNKPLTGLRSPQTHGERTPKQHQAKGTVADPWDKSFPSPFFPKKEKLYQNGSARTQSVTKKASEDNKPNQTSQDGNKALTTATEAQKTSSTLQHPTKADNPRLPRSPIRPTSRTPRIINQQKQSHNLRIPNIDLRRPNALEQTSKTISDKQSPICPNNNHPTIIN